ncbi:MAG: TorF family putative porin [Nitrosomonas sp.]|nr:TorF family putative porin [Nitrosomonas sp.]MBP6075541.1 TorF family putative porin [Nitrosomonas sp.]
MKIRLNCLNHIFLWLLLNLANSVNCYAELSGNLTGTTDYIWRGYFKSDGKPVAQANIDYEFKSGIYLGSFASTVNFADHGFENRSTAEFRPYLGFAYKLSDDWRFNTAWTRYLYDGKIFGQVADYNEFYFYSHFRDLLTINLNFSENSYQQNHMSLNTEITGRYPITDSIEISSTLGYNKQKKVLGYDYLYWTSGLTVYFSRNIGIDARYYGGIHASSRKEDILYPHWEFHPHVVDNRIVFSISVGF